MSHNVAIDGPAGAGKSTIAKRIARRLGYIYVDTGAMYRAMAYYLIQNQVDAADQEAIAAACQHADISICYQDGEQVVLLNGENVNAYLRTEAVGNMASVSSAVPEVRKKLVELQQKLARETNVVMDGRDIGTVVLPDADVKVYLTASVETRAGNFLMAVLEKRSAKNGLQRFFWNFRKKVTLQILQRLQQILKTAIIGICIVIYHPFVRQRMQHW